MNKKFIAILVSVIAVCGMMAITGPVEVSGSTIEVSQPTYLTNNDNRYDRNPSIIYDGTNYWLFYAKADSTVGVRGQGSPAYDPDTDAYVIYYKMATTIAGLANATETKLEISEASRPNSFTQREVSAVYFNDCIYVFTNGGQSGTDHGLYYYKYSGSAWAGPTKLTLAVTTSGHADAIIDGDHISIVWDTGTRAQFYTFDGTNNDISSSAKNIDTQTSSLPKITKMGDTLYVVDIQDTPANKPVHVWKSTDGGNTWTDGGQVNTMAGYWDPAIFNDGINLYVVSAPDGSTAGQQYLTMSYSTDGGTTWSSVKKISSGGYGAAVWWDFWPIGFHDATGDYLFFATETDGYTFSDSEIAYIKLDWDPDTDHYFHIQNAIDAATAGDTVNVAAGTYDENIVVDKSLTLRGANAGISGSGTRGAESIINAADVSDYVVEITADNVTLNGFTITGIANSGENMAAVIVKGKDHCNITNNILTDNYKDAINLFSIGSNYSDNNTVSNNLINGPAGVETFGIKIKGSHNTISGNEIYNTDTSIQIWSLDTSDEITSPDYNTISNNTIAQGEGGEANYKYGIDIKTGQNNTIIDNNIIGITAAGIHLHTSGENKVNDIPAPSNNIIKNNQITGITNIDEDPTDEYESNIGIFFEGADDTVTNHLLYGANNNTVSGNTITGTYYGIVFSEDARENIVSGNSITGNIIGVGADTDAGQDNVVNFNNISGNTVYGVGNVSESIIDATNNWWGDPSGPSGGVKDHEPDGIPAIGTGDKISSNVHFDPWLNAEGESITFTNIGGGGTEVVVEGTATVTVAKYSGNPGSGFSGDIGKYIDVYIEDVTSVTELEIRLNYYDDEVAGKDESSLRMLWWDGNSWEKCSDTGVNTSENFIWAKIRSNTTPYLNNLTGTPFAGSGSLAHSRLGQAAAGGDVTAPSISQIKAVADKNEATISWKTNESSISWLVYGTTIDYGKEVKTTTYTTSHSVTLSQLTPETTYHYQIKSKDDSANTRASQNQTFITLAEAIKQGPEYTGPQLPFEIEKPLNQMDKKELMIVLIKLIVYLISQGKIIV